MRGAAGHAMMANAITPVLAAHLADCRTGWSMGTFGAIGEFTRDADEPVLSFGDVATRAVVTSRGGLCLAGSDELRLIASESLTKESWSQRVALCLPQDRCTMHERRVLTELGPDDDALRDVDRGGALFDLGLGCRQVDVCVRIPDIDTAQALRRAIGQPVFAPGSIALPLLMAANPHRVFLSRLGRLEVFQPIPPPDGRSPDGPHTHILPKLLVTGRTHAATEPLPDGWTPCAHFYPAHPQRDGPGRARDFQTEWHTAFQKLLDVFGSPELVALKRHVMARIAAGDAPGPETGMTGRHERATIRIALRQMRGAGTTSAALRDWLAVFDHHGTDDAIDPMDQLHNATGQP